jgi:hypothetical protein
MNLLLKEFEPKEWGGLTTRNHLGAAYMIEPQKASDFVTMIYQANLGYEDLDTFLNRFPVTYLETDDEYYWDVYAGGERNIPLVAAYTGTFSSLSAVSATSKAGVGHSDVFLEFPESYFFDVNIIFGHKKEYQFQIQEDPQPNGTNWVYRCKLITGDPELFVPYSEIKAGKRFSKQYSGVESTLSKKGGKVHYQSPFRMKNYFTRLRIEDTVPGNMIKRPVGVSFQDPKTKKSFNAWMEYRDWQFEMEFRREKNNALYYSRLNRASDGTFKNKGKSGYEYEQGAGLYQQIESSNLAYYPTFGFSIKWLTNRLLDLSINKLPQDKRMFRIRTGERGMVQFSESLEDYSQLYTPLHTSDRVAKFGKNGLEYSGQFLRYKGPQGIIIEVEHDPVKDDVVHNKDMHPLGGPVEAYTYDILDVGTSNGQPNIVKVAQTGMEDIRGYETGLRNPFSLKSGQNIMTTSTDGYTQHRMWIGGSKVADPTRCMVCKPQIAA